MREFSISVEINASVKIIWQTLMNFDQYHHWNPMFTVPKRQLRVGGFLQLAPIDKHSKTNSKAKSIIQAQIEAIDEQQQLVLSRSLLHPRLVHMVHYFELKPSPNGSIIFSQRWRASGILIPLMWRKLCRGMAQFDRLNQALKKHSEQLEATKN